MKPFRLVLILALLCIFIAPNAFMPKTIRAETNLTCPLTWDLAPSPDLGTPHNQFTAIDARAANDVWAIGTIGETASELLLEHWDGTTWNRVDAPDIGNNGAGIYPAAIATLSATDAWAVGLYDSGLFFSRVFAMHWDGTHWNTVTLPINSDSNTRLHSVSGTNSDDVWAVGQELGQGLLLHWNGAQWEKLPNPVGGMYSRIFRVIANASDDVWLSGTFFERAGDPSTTKKFAAILHWDGVAWQSAQQLQIDYVLYGGEEYLSGFAALAQNDLWLLLEFTGPSHSILDFHTRVLHWNGVEWQTLEYSRFPNWRATDLRGNATDNVWVIPSYLDKARGDPKFPVRHWNGVEYKPQTLPMPKGQPRLNSASVLSGEEVWIVGASYGYPNPNQPYIAYGHAPCAEISLKPELARPRNKQIVAYNHPRLRWRDVFGALYYDIEMRQTRAGTLWFAANSFASSYKVKPKLEEGHTYFWRVRACNNAGCGEWSKKRKFTILSDP